MTKLTVHAYCLTRKEAQTIRRQFLLDNNCERTAYIAKMDLNNTGDNSRRTWCVLTEVQDNG